MKSSALIALIALPALAACQTQGETNAAGNTTNAPAAASGTGGATPAATTGSGGLSMGSLVNVDLRNVLNDLAVRLNLDRANVPVNAQIPVSIALNVCGVTINVLAASTGGQANCTAQTASQDLAQTVQQQIAAGGSVGGGAQGGSTASNSASTPSAGDASTGAASTGATSSGSTQTTPAP